MKNIPYLASLSVFAIALAACEPESRPTAQDPTESPTQGTPTPTPEPTPDVAATPTPDPTTPITPTPTPAPIANIPYGTPVPGKPGFVQSPFAPDSGYVDVRGYAPNTEVRDPYSGKVFLVP